MSKVSFLFCKLLIVG